MNFKKLLSIFLLVVLWVPTWTQNDPYQPFEVGKSYRLLANNVNVRVLPDASAKVFAKLLIGMEVKVLEIGGEHEVDGLSANWYKVSFQSAGKQAEGYVWGGLMAPFQIESNSTAGVNFLYGFSRMELQPEDYEQFIVQIRAAKDKKELSKLEFPAVGSRQTYFTVHLKADPGLSGIHEIVVVEFSDGFCGGAFGSAYLGWTGKEWIHIMNTFDGFDAPYSYTEQLIFPNDEGGKPGKVIYLEHSNEEAVESEAEDLNVMKELERIEYAWQGKPLVRKP